MKDLAAHETMQLLEITLCHGRPKICKSQWPGKTRCVTTSATEEEGTEMTNEMLQTDRMTERRYRSAVHGTNPIQKG